MRRVFAIAAILVLAVPGLALAQPAGGGNQHGNKGGRPAVRAVPRAGPAGHGPVVRGPAVRGPAIRGPVRVGGPGPRGAPFVFHGRPIVRAHFPRPWVYPPGWAYRRWAIGAILPPLFLTPAYYYSGWAAVGLTAPPPGFQWVQYGPDLLLVNVSTGQVVDVAYGVFY